MAESEEMQRGRDLLIDGRSDEEVEDQTGISLLQIIGLRGAAAAAPAGVEQIVRSAADDESRE